MMFHINVSLLFFFFSLHFFLVCTLRGRLKLCINLWRSLGTSQFILNVVSQGYKIPLFLELPVPFFKANVNNASALPNSLFVSQAVNKLLHANNVEEIFCVPAWYCQAWPFNSLIRVFIYSNLISTQDIITSRFFPRIESSSRSLGILDLDLSDIFNFASFRLDCLQPLSFY